jgi:HSP20 family protein
MRECAANSSSQHPYHLRIIVKAKDQGVTGADAIGFETAGRGLTVAVLLRPKSRTRGREEEASMAEKTTEIAPREGQRIGRREPVRQGYPFSVLDRFADEMERVFDDFGFGRSWLTPRWGHTWFGTPSRTSGALWAPDIEVYQRNNELVVRADLPGLKRDDISIDVTDNDLTISGERHQEHETEREGLYRSERTYGSFCRTIPLPEGAMTDQAKASFRDGVLEIAMPAPPQGTRSRRLEIKEGSESKK